jgi:hypothetical protein
LLIGRKRLDKKTQQAPIRMPEATTIKEKLSIKRHQAKARASETTILLFFINTPPRQIRRKCTIGKESLTESIGHRFVFVK